MRGILNKKGSGQFEMVISFVFFMGFILFLFIFLNPGDTTTLSGAVIAGLHDSFEETVYTNLSSLFLKTTDVQANCFTINLPENIFKYEIKDGDSRVVKLNGLNVDSDLNGGNLGIKGGQSFRVTISPEFNDEKLESCVDLSDFQLGSITERRVVSYSSLEKMRDNYFNDYEALKNDLNVPSIYDFAIIPEGIPELEMMPKSGIPSSVEVIARDFAFEIVRSNGTLSSQRINFRIW